MRYRLAFLLCIAVTMNIIPYGGSSHIKGALAISPEEQLSDPILEERARSLSSQLRCLVCQNQSIEDSDAELARDLRKEVRVKLQRGFNDDVILKSLQNTYGDYICRVLLLIKRLICSVDPNNSGPVCRVFILPEF